MAGNKTLDLTIRIAGKMDKSLTATINGTQNRIGDLATNISRLGTVGLAAMGTLATGTVAAIAKCTDAAGEFETQMANVVKYVDGLADANGKVSDSLWTEEAGGNGQSYAQNYADMTDALLNLSTQIPMTAEELTQLAASAGQSGKSISDLIQYDDDGNIQGFLKDVAMMGTAMDISADQAGNWAAKWEHAFNIDHDQVMVLADQINYLGANNATTAAEIAQVVNEAAGLGQVAGMGTDATAALATAMLAMGVDVGKTSNAISRMYVNMSKGSSATKAQKAQWEALGLTAEGVAKSMQVDATGTMIDVFERIQNLDADKQVAALSTLFGQWAIKGAAKLTGNLESFTDALGMVSDPSLYTGSMKREFIIKSSTSGAIDTMMGNAFEALKIDIGTAFLPAKKEVSVALIDFMNQLRNMPELGEIAQKLATLFSQGVEWAGDALEKAMPHIQSALDYLIDHGPEVVDVLKKVAAALAGMKFAPGIENLLGGAGKLIFGSGAGEGAAGAAAGSGGLIGLAANLFSGGQEAGGTAANLVGGLVEASGNGGFLQATGAMLSSLISGNGIQGTAELLQNAANLAGGEGGALSGFQGIGSAILERLQGLGDTGVGQYLGNVGAAAGNFFDASGLKAAGGTGLEILGNLFGFGSDYGGPLNAQPLIDLPGMWQGIKDAGSGAAGWVAEKASAVANSRPVQAVAGAAGRVMNSAPVQGIASIGKGAMDWAGGTLTSGLQLAGTAIGPLASGLGSIVAGATPVVLAISGVISVLSLLWDNVDALRGPIEAVFGEQGLAVFDSFKNGLDGVFGFIQGLFDGGLADAVSPLRGMFEGLLDGGGLISTIFGGTEGGLAAFDGVVSILQSVLGFIGQVVDFANTTMKPVIVEIFTFITGTVMPTIISIFSSAAPTISEIITNVGNIIMTVVQGIMTVLQALWPSIQQIVTVVLDIAGMVIPVLLEAINAVLPVIQGIIDVIIPVVTVAISTVGGLISGLAESIGEIIEGIVEILSGIIDFIQGTFTGNWEQAWNGIKEIFGGAFDALVALCKMPINAVIGIINGAIRGLNSISCDIPDWVPIVGGQHFGISIPEIPLLAKGGFTKGPSIAGEAGTEAVISFQRGVRAQNIETWERAGEMLGVSTPGAAATTLAVSAPELAAALGASLPVMDAISWATGGDTGSGTEGEILPFPLAMPERPVELAELPAGGPGGGAPAISITFAPNIRVEGNADRDMVDAAMMESETRFQTWIEENFARLYKRYERERGRTRYA